MIINYKHCTEFIILLVMVCITLLFTILSLLFVNFPFVFIICHSCLLKFMNLTGKRAVNIYIQNSESAEKTSTKHEYE